jgi:hypothetical protein
MSLLVAAAIIIRHCRCISWREFEAFMKVELAAGKSLLSGEYVLPSGLALPFGAMINKLKRDRMIVEIMEVGRVAAAWLMCLHACMYGSLMCLHACIIGSAACMAGSAAWK